MKLFTSIALTAGAAMLAACGGGADDKAAEKIEQTTENQAGALEAAADNAQTENKEDALEQQAEQVRETGEDKAEMADDQDNASIANEVGNGATGR